jgi:SAM-dependent methyltransferase
MNGMLKKMVRKIPFSAPIITWNNRRTALRNFKAEFERFERLSVETQKRLPLRWEDRYPNLDDRTPNTDFDRHYIYHTAWAARTIADNKPEHHVDISSSMYFTAIVSAFIPVKAYHYQPVNISLKGLSSGKADLLALPFADKSIQSLSCMHVVEHIGLGRYGDSLDPDGDRKAVNELKRVLAPGGDLLFVVPIGKPRIQFNAHRIYSYEHVIAFFGDLILRMFALVPDDGGFIDTATAEMADRQNYGCGCFCFTNKK